MGSRLRETPANAVIPPPAPQPSPTVVRQRTRSTRAVDLDATPLIPAYETALADYVRANAAKNEGARLEAAAKKTLEKAMAEAGISDISKVIDGVTWDAAFVKAEVDEVNVEKLAEAVDRATFFKIISATQTAVKEIAGSVILARVVDKVTKPEALKVAKRK